MWLVESAPDTRRVALPSWLKASRSPWDPSVAWDDWILWQNPQRGWPVLRFSASEASLRDLLPSVYPNPGFLGACALSLGCARGPLQGTPIVDAAEQVFSAYGLRWNSDFEDLLLRVCDWSESLQAWLHAKGLAARELLCLTSLPKNGPSNEWLESWQRSGASRSQAAQALEWASELNLMGSSWEWLVCGERESVEGWLTRLKKARFPEAESRKQSRDHSLAARPWPPHAHARWVRSLDRDGIEFTLQATTPQELQDRWRKCSDLVQKLIEDQTLWRN